MENISADGAASNTNSFSAKTVIRGQRLSVPIGAIIELGPLAKGLACYLEAIFLSTDRRSTFRRRQLVADLARMPVDTLRHQAKKLEEHHCIERVQRERGRRSTTVYLTEPGTGERLNHKRAWKRWQGDKAYIPIPVYALEKLKAWNQQLVYGYLVYRAAMSESDCHCDETSREIGRYLCLARSSVELAVKGLVDLGWIKRRDDGTFALLPVANNGPSSVQNQPVTCTELAQLREANSVNKDLISNAPGDHKKTSKKHPDCVPRRRSVAVDIDDVIESYVHLRKKLCLHRRPNPDDAPVTQLWLVAVLFAAKLISAHEMRDSVEAFKRTTSFVKFPVRYYYACMLELLTRRKARWKRLLRLVQIPEIPEYLMPDAVREKTVFEDQRRSTQRVGGDAQVGTIQHASDHVSRLNPEEAAAIAEIDRKIKARREQERLGI